MLKNSLPLIGAPHAPLDRQIYRQPATFPRRRLDLDGPVEELRPADDIGDSHALPLLPWFKADTIVLDGQDDVATLARQADQHAAGLRMLDNIVQLLLDDPENSQLPAVLD